MRPISKKYLLLSSLVCLSLCGCRHDVPDTAGTAQTTEIVTSETMVAAPQLMYTTPYGTFPIIEEIWYHNVHMLSVPSVPGEELMTSYLTDDPDRADAVRRELADLAEQITEGCTTDAERGRAIAMWVGMNIAYDFDFADDGSFQIMTAERVLTLRRGTCTGFANLYSCLCSEAGIDTLFMVGGTPSDGIPRSRLMLAPVDHAWNAFYADGEWHFVDTTWISDLSYIDGELSGGEQCMDQYADMDLGSMSIEHRLTASLPE